MAELWKWLSRLVTVAELWRFIGGSVFIVLSATGMTAIFLRFSSLDPVIIFAASSLILASGVWAANGIVALCSRRQSTSPTRLPSREVAGQTFRNQTVVLDDCKYIDCTFIDCTFRWSGRPFMLTRGNIQGQRNIEVLNSHAADTIDLLNALGFLDANFAAVWKRRTIPPT